MTALPAAADVVIIGAGFAGASTAWALGLRGVGDVVVLEREVALGRFASGRSAGLGRQLAEDDHTTALTVRGAQLLRSWPAMWAPTGGLLTFDDLEKAEDYARRATRLGVPFERTGKAAVLARWPQLEGLGVAGALWVPSDGVIDVHALLRGFLGGVTVVLETRVDRVDASRRGARVKTSRGTIDARVVVDAAGAWAGLTSGDPPLDSYKRHVFVLEADPQPAAPWIWHVGKGELYLRAATGGILGSPCDAARSDAGHQDPDLVGEEMMRTRLDRAAPELAGVHISRRWACQRAFTEDRRMRLERDDDRPWLVWAAGLGGHGATAAPAVGERVAEAVIAALADATP